MKSNFIRSNLVTLFLLVSVVFTFPSDMFAGTVHSCKTSYLKNKKLDKLRKIVKCYMYISEGKIGDWVEVKNQYNYIVATGKIVGRNKYNKRRKRVVLKEIYKEVKTGYPVTVRNDDSIDHWTATTAPF